MTEELKNKKCVPCEKGGKALDEGAIKDLSKKIKGWHVIHDSDSKNPKDIRIKKLQKNLTFLDFKHVISFVQEVADVAEYEGHHPDLFVHNWNKLTITLSTHAVKGLTENDFIIAAKIDSLLSENPEYQQS